MSKKVKRLFEQFQPENYQLHLKPVRKAMTFSGEVTIQGKKTGRPSQRLTFHQKGLNITKATLVKHDKKGDTELSIARINNQNSFDEVRLHTESLVYPGVYTVKVEFEGKITRAMNGIYPCFYKHNGKNKSLIATQFESHHAREAFPCIDEPEAKATFDLTLTTPTGEIVLANTPVKDEKTKGNEQITTFETTPIMSTYLLAFVYGEMHGVEGKSKRGVEVRSWATVAQPKEHLEYANQEAIDVLDFFEGYFQTPFPLPKVDQVALPDFESLAMENWGLITFREVGLLADPMNRSISAERLITQVVAHEMSHQWFGNLVTMKWWDELWLNESFATIMESLAPDKLHPEWQEWEDFISGRAISCANRDIYKDVQPVGVKVNHPDEILTIFDPSIVYAKGARILKMLFDYIGEEAFREGLANYFKKYAYKNTVSADLWKELSKSSGHDIDALMTPWVDQSGTPEITVKKNKDGLEISQQRFLLDGQDKESLWPIPLLAETALSPDILENRTATIKVLSSETPIFNPTGSGHFITHYDDKEAQQHLYAKIQDRLLASTGRIIALSDLLLQAQAGNQHLTDVIKLVAKCNKEDRDGVWSMFMRILGTAQLLTDGNKAVEDKLKEFRRALASYWYKKLGWDDAKDDDPNTKHLRTTALALSVGGENPEALEIAMARFAKAKTVEALPAEQRALVAGAAVRFGKPSYVKQFMNEYTNSPNPDVQHAIISALCSTKDAKVAQEIVKWGMCDDDIIRPQDIDYWFAYLVRNHYTREVAWQWLQDRWPHLSDLFGDGKKMEYFIWYASRPISSPEWQKRYKEFFEPKLSDVSLKRNILISFSEIQARVDWRKREEPELNKFFLG